MTRAAAAAALLDGWAAPTPAQERLRERFSDHLSAHPDGLSRSCRPAHLTAGAVVLSPDGSQVLLTLHARARRWFQLGGHVEPTDADLAGAAAREAAEESGLTGLRLDPDPVQLSEHPVDFCGPPGVVRHLDVRFLAVADRGGAPLVSEESIDVRWWPVDALPAPEPGLAELVALARTRLAQSTSSPSGGASNRAPADQPIR